MKKTAVLVLICLSLAACGVKPGSVESPDGSENFPRSYPDTRVNPMPGGPANMPQ